MPFTSARKPLTRTRKLARMLALLPVLLLMQASSASAVDFVSIPVSGVAYGEEGQVLAVTGADVPPDYVGQTCQILGQTVNQESVHIDNDLLITTAGVTLTIPNYEDEGFITYDSGEVVVLGPRIDVAVRFGPDGITSGGFRLTVSCDGDEVPPCVPTDEVPCATTTTVAPTTTTIPTTTPTTTPETTTTTEPEPEGPVITGTTTVPSTTTTTAPPPLGPEVGPQLPVTGSSTGWLIGVGAALLTLGFLVSMVARPNKLQRR